MTTATATKQLRKKYDKLDHLERLRAVLAAWERDDDGELRALMDAAPHHTYRMLDWQFRVMFSGLETMAQYATTAILAAAVIMERLLGRVEADAAWRGGQLAPFWGEEDEEEEDAEGWDPDPLELWPRIKELARGIGAYWAALELIAQELGVTREQLMITSMQPDAVALAVHVAEIVVDAGHQVALQIAAEAETRPDCDGSFTQETVKQEWAEKAHAGAQRQAYWLWEVWTHGHGREVMPNPFPQPEQPAEAGLE